MSVKRTVEVFSAGCPACDDAVSLVSDLSCPACDVQVHDMHDAVVAQRARQLGIRSVPAVVIGGELASCCSARGIDETVLLAAGVGSKPS
jgi:glutaredoxin